MTPIHSLAVSATLLTVTTLHAQAAVTLSDNFDDNAISPLWTEVEDEADLTITERNGHLSFDASGTGSNSDDALYLSNGSAGFQLSTASAFNMQIDYSFNVVDASSVGNFFGLVFGVGEDLDGQNSAAIGYGSGNAGFAVLTGVTTAVRIDDAQTATVPNPTVPNTGTFVIDYDPTLDTLTFSTGTFSQPFIGLVQGSWDAQALFVSFGARGNGFIPDSQNNFLDNFQLNTGTLVAIPEPTSLGLITLGGLVLRRRR